jgi:hypothetical protein
MKYWAIRIHTNEKIFMGKLVCIVDTYHNLFGETWSKKIFFKGGMRCTVRVVAMKMKMMQPSVKIAVPT